MVTTVLLQTARRDKCPRSSARQRRVPAPACPTSPPAVAPAPADLCRECFFIFIRHSPSLLRREYRNGFVRPDPGSRYIVSERRVSAVERIRRNRSDKTCSPVQPMKSRRIVAEVICSSVAARSAVAEGMMFTVVLSARCHQRQIRSRRSDKRWTRHETVIGSQQRRWKTGKGRADCVICADDGIIGQRIDRHRLAGGNVNSQVLNHTPIHIIFILTVCKVKWITHHGDVRNAHVGHRSR